MKSQAKLEVEIIKPSETSVKAIHAIRQIMDYMATCEGLSADGKDLRAVYAWFVERYRPGVLVK